MKHIWVQIELNRPYNRELLKGIAQYASVRPEWNVLVQGWYEGRSIESALEFKLDGIILRSFNDAEYKILKKLKIPLVNCSSVARPNLPQVCCDEYAIGRLAAMHLLERGFKFFAYRGNLLFNSAKLRRAGFEACLNELKLPFYDLSPAEGMLGLTWQDDLSDLQKRISILPTPIGIFAEDAFIGRRIIQASECLNYRIPSQIAVICGYDDNLTCVISRPQLSGVIVAADRVGYEAAACLDRQMHGDRTNALQPLLIAPNGIDVRQSSDHLAIEEPDLAEAVRYIREHAFDGIGVDDVVAHVSVSRRWLEQHFRKAFGCTLGEEIRKLQVERAKQLLSTTDWSMAAIAHASGFNGAMRFSANFKQRTGESPSAYRQRCGATSARQNQAR